MFMSLIITLIILGVILYLVNNFIPMDEKFKQLVNIVAIIGAVIYVLQTLGWLNRF